MDITLSPNTPIFEEFECRTYYGKDSLQSFLQLIASSRINLVVRSCKWESPSVHQELLRKASAGTSVTLITRDSETSLLRSTGSSTSLKIVLVSDMKCDATEIVVDNSFSGAGKIDLSDPVILNSRNSFYVCHGGDFTEGLKRKLQALAK